VAELKRRSVDRNTSSWSILSTVPDSGQIEIVLIADDEEECFSHSQTLAKPKPLP